MKIPIKPHLGTYQWMPAVSDSFLPFNLYIKETSSDVRVPVTERIVKKNRVYYKITFADRKYLVTTQRVRSEITLPYEGYRIFDDLADYKAPFVLVNTVDEPRSEKSQVFQVRKKLLLAHSVVQDSGGFQLISSDQTNFIDPLKVINSHNKWADYGVCLDVPAGVFNPTDDELDRLAKILALNNKVFDQNKKPGLRLLNVSHGFTISQRLRFIRTVRNSSSAWCIGGLKSQFGLGGLIRVNLKTFSAHIMAAVLESKGENFFHVLGVGSIAQMVVCAAIAKKFGVLVTSDTSTWLQAAANCRLLTENGMVKLESPDLGHQFLPCACKACHQARYSYLYRQIPALLEQHNVELILRLSRSANRLVSREDWQGIVPNMIKEYGINASKRNLFRELSSALRFVQSVSKLSDITRQGDFPLAAQKNSLWGTTRRSEALQTKLGAIIRNYSEYHNEKI